MVSDYDLDEIEQLWTEYEYAETWYHDSDIVVALRNAAPAMIRDLRRLRSISSAIISAFEADDSRVRQR